ncbi:hypothetical protein E4T56_gene2012 [Termitomyces sp. T112]|nr:hypothetical protein E4T56_gene2012 [Termitomyces sp. T112]
MLVKVTENVFDVVVLWYGYDHELKKRMAEVGVGEVGLSRRWIITDALRHAERRPIFSADRLCRLAVVDLEKFGEGGLMHASHPLAGRLASWPSLPDLLYSTGLLPTEEAIDII